MCWFGISCFLLEHECISNNNQTYFHGWLSLRPFECNLIIPKIRKLFSCFDYLEGQFFIYFLSKFMNDNLKRLKGNHINPNANRNTDISWAFKEILNIQSFIWYCDYLKEDLINKSNYKICARFSPKKKIVQDSYLII